MSIQINLIEILEQKIDSLVNIDVSIDECLRILLQTFKENIEAGAPKELVDSILIATNATVFQMTELFTKMIEKDKQKTLKQQRRDARKAEDKRNASKANR